VLAHGFTQLRCADCTFTRQAALVVAIRGYPEEGLQVLTSDGVEHGVLGVTEPIRRIEMRHALP